LAEKVVLGFRHFYRHGYSFFLEWDELEELVTPLAEVWDQAPRMSFNCFWTV
jgi:hypothetical protein